MKFMLKLKEKKREDVVYEFKREDCFKIEGEDDGDKGVEFIGKSGSFNCFNDEEKNIVIAFGNSRERCFRC